MTDLIHRLWRGRHTVAPLAVFFAFALLCRAGDTLTWSENSFQDFQKGNLKNLSLRSDGLISLAPRFQELFDSSSAYLWALARDSKGNVYTGGGPGAKLYRITPKGEKKTLLELEGMEIHAIAIDRKDRVFVATSPDSKIYRILADGKAEVFFNPKEKYIWAMAFNKENDLFVATGDQGRIYRVTPDGKGSVFFNTDETHARSMIVDHNDNLIVGTDPGGIVIRISPQGKGFVLYQMSKKEVTAVAEATDGSIYAAAVGNKQLVPTGPSAPSLPTPKPSQVTVTLSATQPHIPTIPSPLVSGSSATTAAGGSEVYRIDPSGNPLEIWSNPRDIVYSIAFDSQGRVLLGTGNKGYIYRVDSDTLYTALLNAPPTQITAMLAAPGGAVYAATGNVGKVYQIGPERERQGTLESDVFDAGIFSRWGRLSFAGSNRGGAISIVTRTGNLDQPQKNWSLWSAPINTQDGAPVQVPPARFAQWKATLTSTSGGSPELQEVDLAYLPKNLAPLVKEIDITPPNYQFPVVTASVTSSQTLTLPPMTKRPTAPQVVRPAVVTTPSMQYKKGYIGARWSATDANGDTLVYKVEIRGVQEQDWKPLKEALKHNYLSWDSTAFPDGKYQIRVTASDSPDNPPSEALTGQDVSDPFLVDNTQPRITGLTATRDGGKMEVRWRAVDDLSNIQKAEYSLDGGDWTMVAPVTGLSDWRELDYHLIIPGVSSGEHTVAVRVEDDYDNQTADKVVVKP